MNNRTPEERAEHKARVSAAMRELVAREEARPEVIALRARLARLEAEGWRPIDDGAPKDGRTEILALCEDDGVRPGILVPYWCGADCPCVAEDAPDARTSWAFMCGHSKEYANAIVCEPQCWTLGGVASLATHWKPILVDEIQNS